MVYIPTINGRDTAPKKPRANGNLSFKGLRSKSDSKYSSSLFLVILGGSAHNLVECTVLAAFILKLLLVTLFSLIPCSCVLYEITEISNVAAMMWNMELILVDGNFL